MILFWRFSQAILGLLLIGLFLLNGCMTFRTNDKKVMQYFSERNTQVEIGRTPFRDLEIRYLETGAKEAENLIIFVHGAPGSSNNFHRYLSDHLDSYRLFDEKLNWFFNSYYESQGPRILRSKRN